MWQYTCCEQPFTVQSAHKPSIVIQHVMSMQRQRYKRHAPKWATCGLTAGHAYECTPTFKCVPPGLSGMEETWVSSCSEAKGENWEAWCVVPDVWGVLGS